MSPNLCIKPNHFLINLLQLGRICPFRIFNICVFKGLRSKSHDLSPPWLQTLLLFPSELHKLLLKHKFIHFDVFSYILLTKNSVKTPQENIVNMALLLWIRGCGFHSCDRDYGRYENQNLMGSRFIFKGKRKFSNSEYQNRSSIVYPPNLNDLHRVVT